MVSKAELDAALAKLRKVGGLDIVASLDHNDLVDLCALLVDYVENIEVEPPTLDGWLFKEVYPPKWITIANQIYENVEGLVDLSEFVPSDAKYAVMLTSFMINTCDIESRVDVAYDFYDNLDDYNTYGVGKYLKLVDVDRLNTVSGLWSLWVVKLTDCKFAYDVYAVDWDEGHTRVSLGLNLLGYFK
jgi:hypothetical protein